MSETNLIVLTNIYTTPLRPRSPTRLGIAMAPFITSEMFHTRSTLIKINPFTDMAINVVNKQDKKENTNYLLAQKLDVLTAELRNKPVSQFAFDNFGNIIETAYRKGVKNVITHKRKERL